MRHMGLFGLGWICVIVFSTPSLAQFSAGNVAVLRIGDGATTLSAAAFGGSLYQFDSAGLTVDGGGTHTTYNSGTSTAITTFTSGTSGITWSGTATSDGHLNRTVDSTGLTVGGYAATLGTANVVASTANRAVAFTGTSGAASYYQYTPGSSYSGTNGNFRSVVSTNGISIYTGGNAGTGEPGVRYDADVTTPVPNNAMVGVSPTTVTNVRQVRLDGGALAYSRASTTAANGGIFAFTDTGTVTGNALAPTSSTTPVQLVSLTSNNTSGFMFLDRAGASWGGTGLDTLYVADASNLRKFEWNGTSWVAKSFVTFNGAAGATQLFSVVGRPSEGGTAELYLTNGGAGSLGNNALFQWFDQTPFGTDLSGGVEEANWIVSAGTNYSFRGVDFTPDEVPVPEPATVLAVAAVGLGLATAARRLRRRAA